MGTTGNAASDTHLMMREITLGVARENSKLAPLDADQDETWDRLSGQIAEIRADGHSVDIPFE